jgi:hypothetical protein
MTYGVVRAFQVIVNTLLCLKRLTSAVQLRPWPPHFKALIQIGLCLSVRSQSAFANAPKTACCTSLTSRSLAAGSSFSVRFQSALVFRMAEYCNEHSSCCGHPILADGVAVELERHTRFERLL